MPAVLYGNKALLSAHQTNNMQTKRLGFKLEAEKKLRKIFHKMLDKINTGNIVTLWGKRGLGELVSCLASGIESRDPL